MNITTTHRCLLFLGLCLMALVSIPSLSSAQEDVPQYIEYLEDALSESWQALELYERELHDLRSKLHDFFREDELPSELTKSNDRIRNLRELRMAASKADQGTIVGQIQKELARLNMLRRMNSVYRSLSGTHRSIQGDTSSLAGQYVALANLRKQQASAKKKDDPDRSYGFVNANRFYLRAGELYQNALDMQIQQMEARETYVAEASLEGGVSPDQLLTMARDRMAAAGLRGSAANLLHQISVCLRSRMDISKADGLEGQEVELLARQIEDYKLEIASHRQHVKENYRLAEKLFDAAGKAFNSAARNATDNLAGAALRLRARDAFKSAHSANRRHSR